VQSGRDWYRNSCDDLFQAFMPALSDPARLL
jgi:hypothetical protein